MTLLAGSMLVFGTIGIFRRYIPVSSAMLAFIRGVLGSVFLILFVKLRGNRLLHGTDRRNMLLLIASGALIGFNWMLLFEAYNHTTVAVATLCYYMQPTILILVSPLFFKEKLTTKKALCAAVAVLGMVLVSGVIGTGTSGAQNPKGILLGLGAAALYSTVVIINKLIRGVDAYEKTVIQLLSAAAVMIPYLAVFEDLTAFKPDTLAVIMIAIVGIVHTGMAYAMYFGSMEGLKAQTVAIFSYIDPVTALILSAVILKESLSPLSIVGAVLILGAALFSELGS